MHSGADKWVQRVRGKWVTHKGYGERKKGGLSQGCFPNPSPLLKLNPH